MSEHKNAERCNYIGLRLGSLLEDDPEAYLNSIGDRMICAAKDIYGSDARAVDLFRRVLETGEPDPSTFKTLKFGEEVSLIKQDEAEHFAVMLAFQFLRIHRQELYYFEEESIYGFWGFLKNAGMSHEDIGRYFERFEDEAVS